MLALRDDQCLILIIFMSFYNNVIKIIAWDEHTEVFASLFEGNFDVAPIVVLTSMRPHIFHGNTFCNTHI